MNGLNNKYQEYQDYLNNNFEYNPKELEFPTFYSFLLYESGGDFQTYSKLLGYNSYDEFLTDFNIIHKDNLL